MNVSTLDARRSTLDARRSTPALQALPVTGRSAGLSICVRSTFTISVAFRLTKCGDCVAPVGRLIGSQRVVIASMEKVLPPASAPLLHDTQFLYRGCGSGARGRGKGEGSESIAAVLTRDDSRVHSLGYG